MYIVQSVLEYCINTPDTDVYVHLVHVHVYEYSYTGPARLGGKRGTASGPPENRAPKKSGAPKILSLVLNFQFDY